MKLPSGAELKVTLSEFMVSKALYQAIAEEAKSLKLDPKAEVDVNLYKDLFCSALSSKRIEECLWECMKRATYNGVKITPDVFEPEDARDDYIVVCMEVARINVLPFMKSLYAQFSTVLPELMQFLQPKSQTTT